MNYGLAKEIYGMEPWCMDVKSLPMFTSILKNLQNGVQLQVPETKYNSFYYLDLKSKTTLVTREWELQDNSISEAVGVINLDGPITKSGGESSYGTKQLSQRMLSMSNDSRVKGIIINVDSGGGSSSAVQLMVDAINEVKKSKPVYAVVSKGGMAASAAYGIASAANKMYSEEAMNIVGSVGTMISFQGIPANKTTPDGVKNIVLYATKSTEKNKAFEEALNNDNYDLLINDLLDPINESFINLVESNRPQLKGTNFDNGHTVFAKDGIGTFIDGIATFDEVVNMVMADSKNYKLNSNKNSLTKNQIKMTSSELQSAHPEVYNEVVNLGVQRERERVNSWLAYQSVDAEQVAQGIESGAEITSSVREKLMIKMNSAQMLQNLEQDSAKPVQTEETPTVIEEQPKEDDAVEETTSFYKNLLK